MEIITFAAEVGKKDTRYSRIDNYELARMPVPVYDADIFGGYGKMGDQERNHASVGVIALRFFFYGNQKMVFGFLHQRFFARAGGNLHMDIHVTILSHREIIISGDSCPE